MLVGKMSTSAEKLQKLILPMGKIESPQILTNNVTMLYFVSPFRPSVYLWMLQDFIANRKGNKSSERKENGESNKRKQNGLLQVKQDIFL